MWNQGVGFDLLLGGNRIAPSLSYEDVDEIYNLRFEMTGDYPLWESDLIYMKDRGAYASFPVHLQPGVYNLNVNLRVDSKAYTPRRWEALVMIVDEHQADLPLWSWNYNGSIEEHGLSGGVVIESDTWVTLIVERRSKEDIACLVKMHLEKAR